MEKLAINGGNPAVTLSADKAIEWPGIGAEDLAAVQRVLTMPGYSFYEEGLTLEKEFGAYLGSQYALAHNNGTAAIHAALFAIGLEPGDEVICPSYTYWASCMPVITWNAIPVFADIEEQSLNIDPADIERRITPRTKAIIVVHFGGLPCDMDRIMQIAARHHLKVIEDAAHAHGASLHGKKMGAIGDIGCFSYQASKLMPGVEAGMLVTDQRAYFERAVALGHYERVRNLPEDSPYRKYAATGLGYKYRIHPAAAAITRVRLAHFCEVNAWRNRNMGYLDEQLGQIPGFAPMRGPAGAERVYYVYRLRFQPEMLGGISQERLVAALKAEGALVAPERYYMQHRQPAYVEARQRIGKLLGQDLGTGDVTLPVTESIHDHLLSLPTFPQGDEALLEQYVRAFRKVAEGWRDIPADAGAAKTEVDGSRATIR